MSRVQLPTLFYFRHSGKFFLVFQEFRYFDFTELGI
ncbi:MAG: hypothetical protein ACI9G1_005884 [Pirellulaceae bacterium]